jgi:hypothetical protein
MTKEAALIKKLEACPKGAPGWRQFEDICTEILTHLFVPPLIKPKIQPRSYSGIDRRDALFPNRDLTSSGNWGHLYRELKARMLLVEFKNYDTEDIGKDEVNQVRNYLKEPMGRLAILCCNKKPNDAAHIKRNSIFSDAKTVILFVTPDELKEMLFIKERGEDPSDLLIDMVEWFYAQHE